MEIADLHRDGFVVMRDVLSSQERQTLTHWQHLIDGAAASVPAEANPLSRILIDRYTLTGADVDALLGQPGVYAEFSGRVAERLLRQILGERETRRSMYGGVFVSDPRLPRSSDFYWHPDGHYDGLDDIQVNFWIPLRDCGVVAPGLSLLRASQEEVREALVRLPQAVGPPKRGRNLRTSVVWKLVDDATIVSVFGEARIEAPTFALGDALAFTNWCVHRTDHRSNMTEGRGAMIVRYAVPGHASLQTL